MTTFVRIGIIALAVLGSLSAVSAADRSKQRSQRVVAGEQKLSYSPQRNNPRVYNNPARQQTFSYSPNPGNYTEAFFEKLGETGE